jgi:hypothetical protein
VFRRPPQLPTELDGWPPSVRRLVCDRAFWGSRLRISRWLLVRVSTYVMSCEVVGSTGCELLYLDGGNSKRQPVDAARMRGTANGFGSGAQHDDARAAGPPFPSRLAKCDVPVVGRPKGQHDRHTLGSGPRDSMTVTLWGRASPVHPAGALSECLRRTRAPCAAASIVHDAADVTPSALTIRLGRLCAGSPTCQAQHALAHRRPDGSACKSSQGA